jgi:hypothetical protein
MVLSRHYNPVTDEQVRTVLSAQQDLLAVVEAVLGLSSGRGCPAVEVTHEDDGSSLSLGTDGEWAALVWVDALGASHHSLGQENRETLVYDYFGSWTEAPGDWLVPLEDAVESLSRFAQREEPSTELVAFESD